MASHEKGAPSTSEQEAHHQYPQVYFAIPEADKELRKSYPHPPASCQKLLYKLRPSQLYIYWLS
jgi:hypothetical protein